MPAVHMTINSGNADSSEGLLRTASGRKFMSDIRAARRDRAYPSSSDARFRLIGKGLAGHRLRQPFFTATPPRNQARTRRRAAAPIRPRPAMSMA